MEAQWAFSLFFMNIEHWGWGNSSSGDLVFSSYYLASFSIWPVIMYIIEKAKCECCMYVWIFVDMLTSKKSGLYTGRGSSTWPKCPGQLLKSWQQVEHTWYNNNNTEENKEISEILQNTLSVWNMTSEEMHLFDVCWSQGQIVQAVRGHIPNSIKEPVVSDCLHTQLPGQGMRTVFHDASCFNTQFFSHFTTAVNNWSVHSEVSLLSSHLQGAPQSHLLLT